MPQPGSEPPSGYGEFVSRYKFEPAIIKIFDEIQRQPGRFKSGYASASGQVSPRAFLFMALYLVGDKDFSHHDTNAILRLTGLRSDSIRALLAEELTRQAPLSPAEAPVYHEMTEAADLAKQLAMQSTRSNVICIRHLIGAILTFRNPVEYLYFYRSGVDSNRVLSGSFCSTCSKNTHLTIRRLGC